MTNTLRHRRTVDAVGWAMLSHLVVLDPELSDGAVRLYARLLWYARQAGRCWPGRDRLARDLGVSEPTIKRRLAELEARGLITRERRGNGQTAMTWLEDLEPLYQGQDARGAGPSRRVKFDPSEADGSNLTRPDGSNLTHHEQQQENNKQTDDDDTSSEQQPDPHALTLLRGAGVTGKVARELAQAHDLERIEAVLEHARTKGDNPAGLAVWMLRNGADVPTPKAQADPNDPRRFTSGAYAQYIRTGGEGGPA